MSALPVTLLTGFLGSGKSTLLDRLLGRPEMADMAVLINEFGEVGLDHLLVRAVSGETVILDSGCLCCSMHGEMLTALRDLFFQRVKGEVPEFERVMIETTGLADPAPIIHTLMADPLLAGRYRLDGIVATIDGLVGERTLDEHEEAVKQAALADRLVVTKTDLAEPASLAALEDRLRHLNPAAPILRAVMGDIDPDRILASGLFDGSGKIPDVERWLRTEAVAARDHHHHHHHHDHDHQTHRHDRRIDSFVIIRDRPLSWPALAFALETLTAAHGEAILRIKGIVDVGATGPVAVHAVQHVFHQPVPLAAWPDDDHRSRIVFITRDLPRAIVESQFDAILEADNPA